MSYHTEMTQEIYKAETIEEIVRIASETERVGYRHAIDDEGRDILVYDDENGLELFGGWII